MKAELPVKLHKDWLASLTNAIPLCILLSDDTYVGWYYENYIKIYTHFSYDNFFECNMLDALDYRTGGYIENRLLRYSYVSKEIMLSVIDIHSVIKSAIEKDCFCTLFLDEYYLKTLKRKEVHHYAHEALIYGYDDENQIYSIIAFKDQKMSQLKMPYSELEVGYENVFECISSRAGWDEKMFLQFRRLKSDTPYPFSPEAFLHSLKEYQMGEYSAQDTFLSLIDLRNQEGLGNKVNCGRNVVHDFMEYLMRSYIDFRNTDDVEATKTLLTCYSAFHTLRDHKKGLYERLDYVICNFKKTEKTLKLLKDFERVVELCENIRKLFIKIDVIKNMDEKINKKKLLKIILSMMEKLEEAAKLEWEILNNIIKEMENIRHEL